MIVVAHGNSLRALVKYLDDVSDTDIVELNIPTGQPLVYELDNDLKPIKHYYLDDEEAIRASMRAVANQGTAIRWRVRSFSGDSPATRLPVCAEHGY